MKEIRDIVDAYQTALKAHLSMALATVVKVEGSSYRQPGARMLVTEDGQLTGAISGGCLEGDALRKALLAIHQQKNKLVTYDTTSDDGNTIGVQLGCNGIVHILFEWINPELSKNPITELQSWLQTRQEAVAVTLFSTKKKNEQLGTIGLFSNHKIDILSHYNILNEEIQEVKIQKQSRLKKATLNGIEVEVLLEYIAPIPHLVIIGAGNDAIPVVETAHILGWEITVLDGRATHALPQRFPKANRVIQDSAVQIPHLVTIDASTVFVLMTHNYKYDLAALEYLITTNAPYIGSLGPKTKLLKMLDELSLKGVLLNKEQEQRLFGPMGLDIGAETAEEIAISVVSEIKTVLKKRQGGSLKFLTTKIHSSIPSEI